MSHSCSALDSATEQAGIEFIGDATYSPEDNKLRLYPFARIDKDTYARLNKAGFTWAAKQGLFVAPMWTPAREDLLIELCGELGDEDKSLADRAEERAERFGNYQEKRAKEAQRVLHSVTQISSGIPLGQPILVGHHSERHARKHAEQIENGMRKAVNLWETSEYWQRRAAGVLRHASYKDLPDVRARRIKELEADKRKKEREKAEAEKGLYWWTLPDLTEARAVALAGVYNFPLPKSDGDAPDWHHRACAYDGLTGHYPHLYAKRTLPEVVEAARLHYPRNIARADRWIEHYSNRIAYERALLEEQGAASLLEKKPRQTGGNPPILNYRADKGIMLRNRYRNGEIMHYEQVEMTKAEYAAIHADYKATNLSADDSHRVRVAMRERNGLVCVFITDSKTHDKEIEAIRQERAEKDAGERARKGKELEELDAADLRRLELNDVAGNVSDCGTADTLQEDMKEEPFAAFKAIKEQLNTGVKVVVAPQLFPTPKNLAARMAHLLDVQPGEKVLEPSAGTGHLLGALGGSMFVPLSIDARPYRERRQVYAVEINPGMAQFLENEFPLTIVHCGDFLEFNSDGDLQFDKIIMNPPFANADDIKHIKHALAMLAPGGLLVAICANGSRQQSQLRPLVEACGGIWEELPSGTFKEAGTMVSSVLLTVSV